MSRRPCCFCHDDIDNPGVEFAVGDGRVAHLICLNEHLRDKAAAEKRSRRWFRRARSKT